jgi:2-methylcitrate dehydratase PrpD
MINQLDLIAAWATGPRPAAIPQDAVALVRRAFLDTIAVTLLGSRLEGPRIVADVETTRGGVPQASLIGMDGRSDVVSAALINGTSAHADLFDDNNAPMIAHPSAPLVSALLPLAQVRLASGRDVVHAYAAGFEIGVKLGRMLNPGLYEQGWHVTRVLGVLGTTAACCRLIGLGQARTVAALGIAVSMASGVRQNFGTMTMALHVGLTARDAVHAALLAERGFGADPGALDGKYGFLPVFAKRGSATLPTLGEPLELLSSGIIFKPYPSGAPTHAAVDAALALRARIGGDLSRIARVVVLVHPWNEMTLRAEEPRDALQCRVNMRFCVGAALHFGELTHRQFSTETLNDARLADLRSRIQIELANDLPDNDEFPAEVRVELDNGEVMTERREVPPGGSTRALTQEQITEKMRTCSSVALAEHAIDAVISLVGRLDQLTEVDTLCTFLEGSSQLASNR